MISNSSPLIIFGKLNRLDILKSIFKRIEITESVYEEVVETGMKLNKPESFIIKESIGNFIFIESLNELGKDKSSFLQKTHSSLEKGEADTIAMTLQKKQKYLLLDEKTARKVAKIYGLAPIGIFGVLLLAYRKKFMSEEKIEKFVDEVILSDFRIGGDVINEFWNLLNKIKKEKKE